MNTNDRLRAYVGERIPVSGSGPGGVGIDADTLFLDTEIADILATAPVINVPNNPNASLQLAAAEGWERKAAIYGNMVDHEQGGAKDSMSQLQTKALQEADRFRSLAFDRRTPRIGKIVRPGTTVT